MPITRRQFGVAAASTLAAQHVFAQEWPQRPIRLLVPYTPGAFTDTSARIVAQKLSERLGESVVVDNRPGANGMLAVSEVARSRPDGSTFSVVIAAHAVNPILYEKKPYADEDVTGVVQIGSTPFVAAASPRAPFKTVAELIGYAKAHPGVVNYGTSGQGSGAHLTTALLESVAGIRMNHIPYKGTSPAKQDLVAGRIDFMFDTMTGLAEAGRAGQIRLLGVASESRIPALPELKTFSEQGVPHFQSGSWIGILAQSRTPAAIVERLAREVGAVVQMEDVKSRLQAIGVQPVASSPAAFNAFIAAETRKWAGVIKTANVKVE